MRAFLIVCAFALAACPAKKDTPLEEIGKLPTLKDVMDTQSTIADPLFKKIGKERYQDKEKLDDEIWGKLADASARINATSVRIREWTKGAEFDALANRLTSKADALARAVDAKETNTVNTILKDMKATCKECHQRFR
jgi:cytochrome c556